jgi:hypothetical protein
MLHYGWDIASAEMRFPSSSDGFEGEVYREKSGGSFGTRKSMPGVADQMGEGC